jgi:hypothetical protein
MSEQGFTPAWGQGTSLPPGDTRTPLVDLDDLISRVQKKDVEEDEEENESKCQNCGLDVCNIGEFAVEGLVLVNNNKTGEKYLLCIKCAATRVPLGPRTFREDNDHPASFRLSKRSELSSSKKLR